MSTLIIQHCEVSPPGNALKTLRSYGHSIQLIRTDLEDSVPENLDDLDAVILCGGPQSVRTPDAVLEAEFEFVRLVHAAGIPMLGLCLGAQVLAHALGGEVSLLEGGPEVGFHEVSLTPDGREDPLFKGIPWWIKQFQWHEDEISKLPPDARLLASSKRTKVQAFSVGPMSYGIQYHPEYDRRLVVEHWDSPDRFVEAGGGREELSRQTERDYDEFQRHALRFFESVALFLMPVDRVNAGIPRDIEH